MPLSSDGYGAGAPNPLAQGLSAGPHALANISHGSNHINTATTTTTTTTATTTASAAPPAKPGVSQTTAVAAADQESFYARVLAEGPSLDEIAARATPAYVRSLMETIDRAAYDTAEILRRIEELSQEREQRHAADARAARSYLAEAQSLREQLTQAALQLQEERERSTRLLHENTVLCTHEAEQRERLTALVKLARARRRGRQSQLYSVPSRLGGGHGHRDAGSHHTPTMPMSPTHAQRPINANAASSLSLRVATAPLRVRRQTNALLYTDECADGESHRTITGARDGSPRTPQEESIVKEANDSLEGGAARGSKLRLQVMSPIIHECAGERRHGDAEGSQAEEEDRELLLALRPCANTAAAHVVALTEEVEALRQQLDEQRTVYEQERAVRLQEAREERCAAQAEHERLAATIDQLEQLHECAIGDLVRYRHHTDRALRDLRGQVMWLKQSLSEAIASAELARRQHDATATAMTLRASEQFRPLVRSLSVELGNKRQTSLKERAMYETAITEKDALIEKLRQEVKHERTLKRRAEERHRLEVQGVRSELDLMRQALRQVEKRVFFSRAREAAAMAEEKNLIDHYYYAPS